jgi:hypothetical protein
MTSLEYSIKELNLGMTNALIINITNAENYQIEIKPIKDLYYESGENPGVILFFDKYYDIIMFAESIDGVEEFAKDIEPLEAFYYHIIKDDEKPLTEDEIDIIYDCILNNKFSIHIINQKESIQGTICLN